MNPFTDDLITLIQNAAAGTLGTDLFSGLKTEVPQLPLPSATIHIVATGGTSPDETHNDVITPAYLNPGAQITCRADASQDAETKARAAWLAVRIRNQYVNSGWYLWIKTLQEPYELQQEDTTQSRWVFNVIARRKYLPKVV